MKKIVILSIMMAILFFNQFAVAAGTSITARVGDAIITSHDVETRLNILFLASDLPNDDKVKQQLRRQIRELLIDEEIQRQVAKREEIKIDKKELDETYRNIEKRNNIPNGKLFDEMKKKGISEDAIKKQIEATLGWQKVIQKKYRNQLEIRQSDIDLAKEKIRDNQGKTEYFLSEILLFVNTPQQEESVKSNAGTIYQQLKNGAKFEGVARQFSQSATSANGGAIGWLIADQLPDDARKIITQMEKNTFTIPLRTQLGYKIYKLNDVRLAGVLQSNNTIVDLFQTIIKFVNDNQAATAAKTVIDNVSDCKTAEENAEKNGYEQSGYTKNVAVNQMQKIVQAQVAKLKLNQTTKPIPIDDNIVFMTLCSQSAPSYSSTVVDPDNENIKRTLFSERATQLSQKLLQIEREGLIITKSD